MPGFRREVLDSRRSLKWTPCCFKARKRSNFFVVVDRTKASSLFGGGGEGEEGMEKLGWVGIVRDRRAARSVV